MIQSSKDHTLNPLRLSIYMVFSGLRAHNYDKLSKSAEFKPGLNYDTPGIDFKLLIG